MSLFTNAKRKDAEIEALVTKFLTEKSVTSVVTKAKNKGLSLASRHMGKPNYGRKSRRYA